MRTSIKGTHTSRGFTLIEILVVIAITGIIASISTVSFTKFRNRGNDGAVKTNLSSLQLAAELYYRQHRSFSTGNDGSCTQGMFADPGILSALDGADAGSPRGRGDYGIHCRLKPQEYAVWVQRPSGSSSRYWCIDSRHTSCGVELGDEDQDVAPPSLYEPVDVKCGVCTVEE